jgi:SEC-C motif-containing protein
MDGGQASDGRPSDGQPSDGQPSDGQHCPCGLGDDFEACCGRFHAGAPAPTAEALMRSRYSAFAVGDAEYLRRTWHPSGRPERLDLDPDVHWQRLAVLATEGGGIFDPTGTVTFRAVYVRDGQRGVLAETSRFVREDGRWVYLAAIG